MTSARPVSGLEVRDSIGIERKGSVQHVIETLATGMGNAIGFAAETGILFVIFAALWAAFGAGLIWSQGSVDAAWDSIRALPLLIQGIVWILFLPVMAGMWTLGDDVAAVHAAAAHRQPGRLEPVGLSPAHPDRRATVGTRRRGSARRFRWFEY